MSPLRGTEEWLHFLSNPMITLSPTAILLSLLGWCLNTECAADPATKSFKLTGPCFKVSYSVIFFLLRVVENP